MLRLVCTLVFALVLARPAQAITPEKGVIEAEPGIRLYYERFGSGPQVVIVPGRFLFNADVRPVLGPERTVIFYDMRNRGRSSRVADDQRISINSDVGDLEAVRRFSGADRVSVIGYSYLGMMAALYASKHPNRVERLVQIGPVPIEFGTQFPQDLAWKDANPVVPEEQLQEIRSLRERGLHVSEPRDFCLRSESLTRLRLVGEPSSAERIDVERRCSMANEWPVNLQRHFQAHFPTVQNLKLSREGLQSLSMPVLVLHGEMDRNAPLAGGAEWAMTFPNARLIVAPRAAHQVWLDHKLTFSAVDEFLTGEWPDAAVSVRSWDDVRQLARRIEH